MTAVVSRGQAVIRSVGGPYAQNVQRHQHTLPHLKAVVLPSFEYQTVMHVSVLALSILIAAGLCALFLPFLHSEFILDDSHKIVENHDIRDWTQLPWSLFPQYAHGERDLSLQFKMNRNDPSRPLTFLMYTLEYRFAEGAHPWIFRIVNILLHGANGILLYSLMNLLCKSLSLRVHPCASLNFQHASATLLWVFTPLNISTANYAYSRSEILGFTLELCCFRALLKGHSHRATIVCLTLLSLCAKQSYICIAPCVFMLFLLFPSLGCRTSPMHHSLSVSSIPPLIQSAFYRSIPCLVAAVLYMGYRCFYLGGLGDLEADPSNQRVPFLHYLRTQPFAVLSYILITCWGGVAVDHGVLVDDPVPILFPCFVIGSLFIISCCLFCKYPLAFKAVLFGWAFALLHLAPTSLLVTTDVMADRRFYAASFPFLLMVCSVTHALLFKSRQSKQLDSTQHAELSLRISVGILGILGVVLIFFGTVAYQNLKAYENNISAWRSVLGLYPSSVRAHNNLATSLIKNCRSCPPGQNFALQSVRLMCPSRCSYKPTSS